MRLTYLAPRPPQLGIMSHCRRWGMRACWESVAAGRARLAGHAGAGGTGWRGPSGVGRVGTLGVLFAVGAGLGRTQFVPALVLGCAAPQHAFDLTRPCHCRRHRHAACRRRPVPAPQHTACRARTACPARSAWRARPHAAGRAVAPFTAPQHALAACRRRPVPVPGPLNCNTSPGTRLMRPEMQATTPPVVCWWVLGGAFTRT